MRAIARIYSVLLLVAGLCSGVAGQAFTTTEDGMRTVAISSSKAVVPATESHAKRKILFSNLSDYKYATYFCCSGALISGPNAQHSFGTTWLALPVTPKENVTLTHIEAPFTTITGTPSISVWLAADADGVPGATIAGPVDVGTLPLGCCALAKVKFARVPLTKGTQYWIVVGTDSNSMDSLDAWQFNTTDMRLHPDAIYSNGSWAARTGLTPAIGIFGK